jgi:short-subunit dehydrogenase
MALSLENKNILITGSSDGLGKLLAIELAKHKSNIILHGKNEDKLKHILNEIQKIYPSHNHSYVVCDLNHPETIKEKFSSIAKLDILVNNAGVWEEGNTIDISLERITELVNVNLSSYLLISKLLLPNLLKSDFSQILNVISISGYEVDVNITHTIYQATKYALQGFSEAMTKEFTNQNLRVMGFYPGGMVTGLFKKAGCKYKTVEPWMFDPMESVEAIIFMLTRNQKVNIKRLDLITHMF